ncbi:hypothetical protein CN643_15895 [Parageobacillus yumthangensis]|nr:hypothetical protein CN643_15895 [Parageobacillus yumthangensis]TXK91149.1 radical SAM protein [Parageobacillus sp. SY1]
MIKNNDKVSLEYRRLTLDRESKKILITNFFKTAQEKDLSTPPNCKGFGRIRHFKRGSGELWPQNPLPIDPAIKALSLKDNLDELEAQVFQTASCNWRCWYCFVPYNLLSANEKHASWLTAGQLIDYYLEESERPRVIVISGGQPELVPEFVLWMMEELMQRNLDKEVFLWSDDNLSCDYFWRFLSEREIDLIVNYENYCRVGCFKGFDEKSFSFNTNASPEYFYKQFEIMRRYIEIGLDMYAYATFTFVDEEDKLYDNMCRFIDMLQEIDENFPLRTVPLEIFPFSTVIPRIKSIHERAIKNQYKAIKIWTSELEKRFPDRYKCNITEITINNKT